MHFHSLILKNLTRRLFRTSLTLLAFATAIAAVVALLGIAKGFTKSFAEIYQSHAIDIVVSRQGTADRLSSSVDADIAEKIAAIPGVARTAGVLLDTMSLEEQEVYAVPTVGLADDSWMRDNFRLTASANSIESDRQLMLGKFLAERAGLSAGDTVMMFEESWIVSAIVESPSTWENGSMFMSLDDLQQITDRSGQVTYVNVVLDHRQADSASSIIYQIQELDPKLHALTTAEFVATDTRMQIAAAMAWMTSMIALIIGAIGILNTMMTSVLERTAEIGILRAIGWPRSRVVKMVLLESCLLALMACVAGVILAALLSWSLSQSPQAKGIITPSMDGPVIFQGFLLALGIGLLGAIIPAWRAARMLPTEAFRHAG